ncbi:MAG: hypothetical protein J6U01_08920 [Clostridia bacterium]|nr:hypothetical protein [Clostridia bacterium]
MKKLISISLSVLLILAMICSVFAEPAEVQQAGWQETLSGIDGVLSVKEIPLDEEGRLFDEEYLVVFEQPLDWKNPEAGTFPQRVVIGLRAGATVNVISTEGYALTDFIMGNQESNPEEYLKSPGNVAEPAELLKGNFIQVEHRFFGKSRPEALSNDEVTGWEYHTAENAANDYHRIYTALAPLLSGKWLATGASRGGDMTNTYGYFFPEDMDVYMPYVAPSSMVRDDARFYHFVYEEIGNAAFGEEKAAELRALLLSFQVMMLKHKAEILPKYEAKVQQMGCVFRPQVDPAVLYDINVLEFGAQFWQYQRLPFEKVQQALDMPETTPEELQAKLDEAMGLMLQIQSPSDYSATTWAWPYYVNAATTYGQFRYDFSAIRRALEEAGVKDVLSVTEEMEEGLMWNIVFTEEQKAAFVYDGSYRQAMLEAMKTTDAKHLMIFGATDPWTSEGITECDNPNVKIYFHPTQPHSASVSAMPEEMLAEVAAVLLEWLSE